MNKEYKTFLYDNNLFNVVVNKIDTSGDSSIMEIVTQNEYILSNFKGLSNKILFDIGANCGIATIIMAKLNPDSIVYSFEPSPYTYELLCENIKLNNLTNVKTYNQAVMSEEKEFNLLLNNTMSGASTLVSNETCFNNYYTSTSKVIVKSVSFDKFLETNNINNIYLLKIDCEGGEYDILYNSKNFKNNLVNNIVGEFHNFKQYLNDEKNNGKALIDYCKTYVKGVIKLSILNLTSIY